MARNKIAAMTTKILLFVACFFLASNAFTLPALGCSNQLCNNEEAGSTTLYAKKKKFSINEDAGKMGDVVIKQGVTQYEEPNKKKVPNAGMALYVKAGPDGKSLGDCPFAHYVQMCLQHKGLQYDLRPSIQETKPTWLVENYEGKMPCLVDKGEAYTESGVIADYIEFFYPEPPLTSEDDSHKAAMEETSSIFPALAKYIKNLDPAADPELQENLFEALRGLNKRLEESGKPYLCGDQVSLADFSLAPKLYHMQVCLKEFKSVELDDKDFSSLNTYMNNLFELGAFKRSSYPSDVIVWGWNNARGTT